MQTLRVEKQGYVTTVSLNRPEVRNAFHPQMIQELTDLFSGPLGPDAQARAVILKGEGTSFCSGADLSWMKSMVDYTVVENQEDAQKLFDMFLAIRSCPVPVIGQVHGHVMGGALGLIAVCDVVAAEKATQFCFSEVKLGLAPAVISPFVLDKMHATHAHRYMLTGEVFTAPAAEQSGLVHLVGSEAEVKNFVEGLSRTLVQNGSEAVRSTKELLCLSRPAQDWDYLRQETARVIAERRVSAEGQEGLRSFLEKRTPSWKVKE